MEIVLRIETKVEKFNEHLYLESGRLLEGFEIIYETYGQLNEDKSNVIVICHALSGSHHAAGRCFPPIRPAVPGLGGRGAASHHAFHRLL